jgi:hypothetical protein
MTWAASCTFRNVTSAFRGSSRIEEHPDSDIVGIRGTDDM